MIRDWARNLKLKTWRLHPRGRTDFFFVHINKTGGSSIESALNLPFGHKTALQKIQQVGREKWDAGLSFTVVRNPWDKVLSHYLYRVKTNQTGMGEKEIKFNDWVRLTYGEKNSDYYDKPKMFMPQMDWICDENGVVLVDEILRFENLAEDFDGLAVKIGQSVSLPHLKKTQHGNYYNYYDNESVEIIGNWFQRDIDEFGYRF